MALFPATVRRNSLTNYMTYKHLHKYMKDNFNISKVQLKVEAKKTKSLGGGLDSRAQKKASSKNKKRQSTALLSYIAFMCCK